MSSELPGRVLALLRYFPTYSELFVYRELATLRAQGFPLDVLTLRHHRTRAWAAQSEVGGKLEELPRWPLYAPILRQAIIRLLKAPRACLRALVWGRRQLKWKECLKALYLAQTCRVRGIRLLHVHFAGEAADIAEVSRLAGGPAYSLTLHARDLFVPRPSVPTLLENAASLVCISEYNRQWIREHFGQRWADKCVVHRLGVPFETLSPAPSARDGHFELLCVARLVPKKGLLTLFEALKLLKERGFSPHLTLVGEGKQRPQLEAYRQQHQLEAYVTLCGAQSQQELEACYQVGLVAFVLACETAADGDQDGIPVSLMEAMARAVPVISTTVSGIPELVRSGEEGLLVPPRHPVTLADALQLLAQNPALRERLGSAARRRIQQDFELGSQTAHLRQHLTAVLQKTWMRPEGAV
ncbi:MAG: glycosyltransferase family 4 protein [Myxococcota bacterium]